MNDYTETVETVNGVEVKIYGGALRPVLTYALPGHVTGWLKRNGARATYAELTCTCHLTGEARFPEGRGEWISYGSEGWADRLNTQALAHVENVTAHGFMFRPAGGDRDRIADRTRVSLDVLREALSPAQVEEVLAGRSAVYDETGNRYEVARDRSPYTREPLPVA